MGDKIRTTLSYIVALVYHVIQSAILEHGRFNATKTVLWCNGNTSDFGSEIPSSSLGRITIVLIKSTKVHVHFLVIRTRTCKLTILNT